MKRWTGCLPKVDALIPKGNKKGNSYLLYFYMFKALVILENIIGAHFLPVTLAWFIVSKLTLSFLVINIDFFFTFS